MSLPTPLEMSALGGALLLGAAAVIFFLKAAQIGIYMALFGLFLLGCAWIASDYEKMGDAKAVARLQPTIDNLTAKIDAQRTYAAKLILEQNSIADEAQKKAKAANEQTINYFSGLLAQAQTDAKARATPAPASTVRVLDAAVSAANTASPSASTARTSTDSATTAEVTSESDLNTWGVLVAKLYADARNQVIAIQKYYNDQRAAQMTGAPK